MQHHLRAIKVWELHCLARTMLQLWAQFCEKLKILATGFQLQPLPQSSFSCCCSFYQTPPHTFTAYWAASPLPLHVPVWGTSSWFPLSQRILSVHKHVGAPERILQHLSLVRISEDSDCYQSSRQQAPCAAMCQCDGISEGIAECLFKQDSCTSSLGLGTLVSPENKTP